MTGGFTEMNPPEGGFSLGLKMQVVVDSCLPTPPPLLPVKYFTSSSFWI